MHSGLSFVSISTEVPITVAYDNPEAKSSTITYRPDIDGLRAIAVSLVIASHIGVRHLMGGFIGVDIFFVISGYLISSILLRDFGANRFSIGGFYERRIRRIFPALVAMLTCTTVVAWRQLFPGDLVDYARSLIAAALSVSNIYFWQQSGYFAPSSARRPLLHTWSLGVEEQFYVFFPLVLLVVHRYARRWLSHAVWSAALVSFIASAVLVFRFPDATFYLLPTRIWELMAGTALSMWPYCPSQRFARNIIGLAGLILIFGGAIFIAPQPFPGAAALIPCVGAVLLIASGKQRDTLAYRLLSLKFIVFIGAISYSLYLWHWPLIALRHHGFAEPLALGVHTAKVLTLMETFALGYLSWRFIETPFRSRFRLSRRTLFALAGCLTIVFVVLGAIAIGDHGVPQRFTAASLQMAQQVEYGGPKELYRRGHCMLTYDLPGPLDTNACLPEVLGGPMSKPTYLLIGSSLAAGLWSGLAKVYPDVIWGQATASNCQPVSVPLETPFYGCTQMRNFIFHRYLPAHHVDAVVLFTDWIPRDSAAVDQTLAYLESMHFKVFVLGPIPSYDAPLPELLARGIQRGETRGVQSHLSTEPFEADKSLAMIVGHHPNAQYISLLDLLCPNHVCVTLLRGSDALQTDEAHLSGPGAIYVAERLRAIGSLYNK